MDPRDHLTRTKQEFTRQAEGFAASAATADRRQARRLVDALPTDTRGLVLDVACGPGIVTAELAATVAHVVALDLTPQMLTKAQERCAERGFDNVTFQEGSATDLPFAEGSFDAVVTRLSLHHFQDPRRVLGEMHRVVRPGGALLIADVTSSENSDKAAVQNAIEVLRDPSHVRMLPASEMLELVRGANFSLDHVATWDKAREFEEWAGIVADDERIRPLRTLVAALAAAGEDAGMDLVRAGSSLLFVHRWQLVVARKTGRAADASC